MALKPYKEMAFHPATEQLVEIIMQRTQQDDPLFFRVQAASYWAQVASMMGCSIKTLDRGVLPVNMYALNLAPSGFGKGKFTNLLEDEVIDQFQDAFVNTTFPLLAQQHLPVLSQRRAARKQSDPDTELERIQSEFDRQGPLAFNFAKATTAAVRQQRHKLLMAGAGALNLIIDEIGSNLGESSEVLDIFLELFDIGKIKQNLLKNTNDNSRDEEITGRTPTNLLMFGTPARVFNGSKSEEVLYEKLETGYARRCFFGMARSANHQLDLTAREILAQRLDKTTAKFVTDMSDRFGDLADIAQAGKKLHVSEAVTLLLIEYEQECLKRANKFGEHDEIRRAEMTHRHFKALKLAGAYAFIDGLPEITAECLEHAVKLAEESGKAFDQMLTRDRPYVKLAKYLGQIRRPVTQADLVEDCPFYKGNIAQKAEMLQLAIAHGYQNNIIIRKMFEGGIEFLRGETLQTTDLKRLRVSYSNDIAQGYMDDVAKWDDLHKMTQAKGIHWCNHHFREGHRSEDNAIPGFNLMVLDVEKSVSLPQAQELLKDYKALFYTTKRHTRDDHRFRIVLPTNYFLELDAKDYKEFCRNLFDWLPFEVDDQTGQRARKWLSHAGQHIYQDGELLDVLPFIPKTSKNEEFKKQLLDQQGLDNLERWVLNNSGDGNRNSMLHRFARVLVDNGLDFDAIRQRVNSLNAKMPDSLSEAEVLSTVMVTVGKAIARRAA